MSPLLLPLPLRCPTSSTRLQRLLLPLHVSTLSRDRTHTSLQFIPGSTQYTSQSHVYYIHYTLYNVVYIQLYIQLYMRINDFLSLPSPDMLQSDGCVGKQRIFLLLLLPPFLLPFLSTITRSFSYCIPRKYNVPLIITNLTSALNSLKFLVVNVLRYAHAHVKHVKNRYHKGTLKWINKIVKYNGRYSFWVYSTCND